MHKERIKMLFMKVIYKITKMIKVRENGQSCFGVEVSGYGIIEDIRGDGEVTLTEPQEGFEHQEMIISTLLVDKYKVGGFCDFSNYVDRSGSSECLILVFVTLPQYILCCSHF
jgi:hypothetical protein